MTRPNNKPSRVYSPHDHEAIVAVLAGGRFTSEEIAEKTGLPYWRVSDCVRQLKQAGRVHPVGRYPRVGRGSTAVILAKSPAPPKQRKPKLVGPPYRTGYANW
jgi:hypothetical protein